MESAYHKLIADLDSRDKHIIQLEAELLRIDYQYGVIVKDLKEKYAQIVQQFNSNAQTIKQLKRENKKLKYSLSVKNDQNQQLRSKIDGENMKNLQYSSTIKGLKQQNQMLRNQNKYLQSNQSKYQLKAQQSQKKKQQYKQQSRKLEEKNGQLQKQVKKLLSKKKELQNLVQQQVVQTQYRIQNIGVQLLRNKDFQQYQNDKVFYGKDYSPSSLSMGTTKIQLSSNPEQILNDWQTDMKKLKNCIDYGNSYILVFDPMNLDRAISRQIFKFFKKCLKQREEIQQQNKALRQQKKNMINSHKSALQNLQQQVYKISHCQLGPQVDSQTQTDNPNSPQAQKAVIQLSQLNTKLRIRVSMLIDCVDILALRNVAAKSMLINGHLISGFFRKKLQMKKSNNSDMHSNKSPAQKLKKILMGVFFIQILTRKYKQSMKTRVLRQQKGVSKLNDRLNLQVLKLSKNSVVNVQIQKLKDSLIMNRQNLYGKVQEIVEYYEFKLKNTIQQNSLNRQLILW